jgi:hypothetical protein
MIIGEGLLEGRNWAMQMAGTNRPEGKGYVMAYGEWLRKYHVDDMDKSDRAKLLQIMEERAAVEEWRTTLTDYDRRNLNNPTIVWRKWTAATRVTKPKATRGSHSNALRDSELSADKRRLQTELLSARERLTEVEEELAAAKAPAAGTAPPATLIATLDHAVAVARRATSWPDDLPASDVKRVQNLLDTIEMALIDLRALADTNG